MATLKQIEEALRAADAAGNVEDATRLAEAYQQLSQQQAKPQESYEEKKARALALYGRSDPTEGMSRSAKFMAGMGKSAVDTGRGVSQLFGGGMSPEQVDAQRAQDAPLMGTGWGMAGNVTGQALQMATPVPGAAGVKLTQYAGKAAPYVGAGARAGVVGGLQPVGEGESRAQNAGESAAWGVAGQGIASGLGVAARRAKQGLEGPVRHSIEMARKAGIPLHVAQVTNSRALKGISSVFNHLPFSGANAAARKQQEAFNRAVGRSFGVDDGAALTDDVMEAAQSRIGAVYDDIYSRHNVKLDDEARAAFDKIRASANRNLGKDERRVVINQLDDILESAKGGEMPGRLYQSIRTDRLLKLEGGSKSFQADTIRDIRKALDAAAERSVGGADAHALALARRQYRNLKTVQKALAQAEGSKGNVNPGTLWGIVNQKYKSTPELRELAKIGKNVLQEKIPNSGTPERTLWLQLLGLGGGGAMMGATLPALAKLAGVGMVGGRVMNSPLAARALGEGKPMAGLAKLAKPAPRLLPAGGNAMQVSVAGGRVATPEDLERDEEIVRRFRARSN